MCNLMGRKSLELGERLDTDDAKRLVPLAVPQPVEADDPTN